MSFFDDYATKALPPVGLVKFHICSDPQVEQRIKKLFEEDQLARAGEETLIPEDRMKSDYQRRVEVMRYLEMGVVNNAESLYFAAVIFQHGNCSEHYKLANELAKRSMENNFHPARWLFAATLDRYLLSVGKLQKYGTQYLEMNGTWELQNYDLTTTDAERALFDVKPLEEQLKFARLKSI